MKFKIICVVIIAAAIAAILGMALLQKDAPQSPAPTPTAIVAPSVNPGQTTAVAEPAPAPTETASAPSEPSPIITPPVLATSETKSPAEPPMDPSIIPRTAKGVRLMVGNSKDKPPILEAAARNPMMFAELDSAQKVVVLSSYLNMNEEQEVMLASYLEEWEKFQNDNFSRNQQSFDPRRRGGMQGGPSVRVPVSLDTKLSELEIAVQEVKEIRGLREKFYDALTKQQKGKLDELPIKAGF